MFNSYTKMVPHSRKDKEEVKLTTDGIPSTKSEIYKCRVCNFIFNKDITKLEGLFFNFLNNQAEKNRFANLVLQSSPK